MKLSQTIPLVAIAFWVGATTAPVHGQGSIVYFNPPDITLLSDGVRPAAYDLDLDGNGIVDYTFKAVSYFRIEPAGINEVVATRLGGGELTRYVNPLAVGLQIGGSVSPPAEWIGAEVHMFPGGGSAIIYPTLHGRSTLGTVGLWQSGVNAYVGTRFAIGTELHYGWIKVLIPSISSNGGIIEEWAYNSIPGEFILAGQVPEPGTVALLLAGGGFLWWRARRVRRQN